MIYLKKMWRLLIIEKVLFIGTIIMFVGCSHPEPGLNSKQLESDKKDLLSLIYAYQKGELEPLAYLKQSRLLRQRILKHEEYSGSHGHSH